MKKMKNPTIKDIADIAQVTNVTVSRVFTSPEKVKLATREKILAIAQELGYVPNEFARSVRNNQTNIIGIVSDDTFNPVYAHLIKQLCIQAGKKGYSVMIFTTNGSRDSEVNAINTLIGYKAAGIILSVTDDSPEYDATHIEMASRSNSKLLLIDRETNLTIPGVYLNNLRAGKLVAEEIAGCAYKRVLVIGSKSTSRITQQRLDGIKQKLSADVEVDTLYADYTFERTYEKLDNFFSISRPEYDCIVGLNGPITAAVIGVFNSKKLTRPALISIDEVTNASYFGMEIPSVSHNCQVWAEYVVSNMVQLIEGKEVDLTTYIDGSMVNSIASAV